MGTESAGCSSTQSDYGREGLLLLSILASLFLSGCQAISKAGQSMSGGAVLHGRVHGGQQPVSNAVIGLYAAGVTGPASDAQSLLSQNIVTDSNGDFNLDGLYTCTTPDAQIFLTAKGGNPGINSGGTNPNLSLMAALGPCNGLLDITFVNLNEETTVAAVWPLARFMSSPTSVGSNAGDPLFADAVFQSQLLVNIASGTAPGTVSVPGYTVQTDRVNHLADILASCVNSPGGTAGDQTLCGLLFAAATPPSDVAPMDTVTAALRIAQSPTRNVASLFDEISSSAPFEPALLIPPADWTLNLLPIPAAPTLTPPTGSYSSAQTVSMTAATPGAVIYYTLDGSSPTASSSMYSGPFSVTSTTTVTAAAALSGLLSSFTTAHLNIESAAIDVTLTPGTTTLGAAATQQFTATVNGTSNAGVTWTLSPAVGTVSASGFYTAPASISSPQSVTVKATSVADPTRTATASISLTPPISVMVSPGSVTLGQAQTQAFAASVANTSNAGVTWTLSPAVGTVSASGFYTAPASISSPQSVTVKATSVADPTRTATASISLTPPISVMVSPGSVTLGQAQTQAFAASVANTSNAGVTWTLSPAVGTVSASGLYTAPASISSPQSVTVKATSVADPTRTATASISLTPPTYYVDNVNGDDSNSGQSTAAPWQTLAQVNANTFRPGTQILLKRGDVWHEQLTVPSSGSSSAPITISNYGSSSSPLPIIDGADVVSGWTLQSATTYKAPYTATASKAFVDSLYQQAVPLVLVTSVARVNSTPGTIYSDGSFVYVNLSDESNPASHTIEVSGSRPFGVYLRSQNYVTISGLQIIRTTNSGVRGDQLIDNNVVSGTANNTHIVVNDSTFFNIGDTLNAFGGPEGAIAAEGLGSGQEIALPGWAVTNNQIGRMDFAPSSLSYTAGGIELHNTTGAVISGNYVATVNGMGIQVRDWFNTTSAQCDSALVTGNEITNSEGNISVAGCPNSVITSNNIHDSFGFGVGISNGFANPSHSGSGATFSNNTITRLLPAYGNGMYNGEDCNATGGGVGAPSGTASNNNISQVAGASMSLESGCLGWHLSGNTFDATEQNPAQGGPSGPGITIYMVAGSGSGFTSANETMLSSPTNNYAVVFNGVPMSIASFYGLTGN